MSGFVPVKLSYRSFYPSEGAEEKVNPIIFIHGLLLSKASWHDIPQVIANKTRRKTLAYDVRNHGDSEHKEEFSFDLNVEDLFHLMDSLDIQKAVLVGHSMGGYAAIRAALKKPERVESIFVEDMYVKLISEDVLKSAIDFTEELKLTVEKIPSSLNEKDAIKTVVEQIFAKLPPDSPFANEKNGLYETDWDFKRKDDGRYEVKFNFNVLRKALGDSDRLMSKPSGTFDDLAYFIYGSISTMEVFKEEDHIRKHFPNAVFIEFEGATHNVHIEYPEKFIETLLRYL